MSSMQRRLAEVLRAKYARVFGLSVDDVRVDYVGDHDARVYAEGCTTVWTLGWPEFDPNAQRPT